MNRVIVVFLVFWVRLAIGQEPPEFEIPCSEAGPDAITEMPAIVRGVAAISCTVNGHFLTAAKGYLWNRPGTFSPVIIPAQMVDSAPEVVNHDYYFKSVSAQVLTEAEAVDAREDFLKGFDDRPDDSEPVIEISVTNQLDVVQRVYLIRLGGNSVWGYTCQTSCKPDMPFMVLGTFDQ